MKVSYHSIHDYNRTQTNKRLQATATQYYVPQGLADVIFSQGL